MAEKTAVVQVLGDKAGAIEVTTGTLAGTSALLSRGTFVIGRDADCDLALLAEPGVSRVHARIVSVGDRYRLIDNESRNGTLVNGQPVRDTLLHNGDTIDIAQCRMVFRQMGVTAAPAPAVDASQLVDTASIRSTRRHAGGTHRVPAWMVAASAGATVAVILGGVLLWSAARDAGARDAVAGAVVAGAATPNASLPARSGSQGADDAPSGAQPLIRGEVSAPSVEVRADGNGRVQALPVAQGAPVKKGTVIAVLAGDARNTAAIATRRESIATLEPLAASNEAAAKLLAEEKAALKALLSRSGAARELTSPANGTLAVMTMKVGESLRSGQVIGRVDGPLTARATVAIETARQLEVGARCILRSQAPQGTGASETVHGLLESKTDRGPDGVEVTFSGARAPGPVEIDCASPSRAP